MFSICKPNFMFSLQDYYTLELIVTDMSEGTSMKFNPDLCNIECLRIKSKQN